MNKILYEPRGTMRKLYCKFRGWSYDLDGGRLDGDGRPGVE
jgi:hypothetical protein